MTQVLCSVPELIIHYADALLGGHYLVCASGPPLVLGWDLASGEQIVLNVSPDDLLLDLAWSPAGQSLALLALETVYLYDCVQQRIYATCASEQEAGFYGFSWSPGGTCIASSGEKGQEIRVWRPLDWAC
jgi:WD40 repeat protein